MSNLDPCAALGEAATSTIRRVPGKIWVARFFVAMTSRLAGSSGDVECGRSGCAVVTGAVQPTDEPSVATSIVHADHSARAGKF